MIGTTLGRYKIVGELGEGGMGVVYLAEHPLIGSKAVVKKLRPELCTNREVVERFFNEARAATRIKHAGIVAIFDFGYADDGTAYLVMEKLDGESLGQRLTRVGSLPEPTAVRLIRQIAGALAAAHDSGIVHRDLKPDNVFVVKDAEVEGGERVKILDFGIAKLSSDEVGGVTKTRTGVLMGSPLYMAPEQCRGAGEVDARADIYALGCVAYHFACGRPPFVAQGVGEIVAMHIYEAPVPPRARVPEVSPAFERFILRCLEKRPSQRFATMGEAVRELELIRGVAGSAPPGEMSGVRAGAVIAPTIVAGATPGAGDTVAPARAVPTPTVASQSGVAKTSGFGARRAAVVGALVLVVGGAAAVIATRGADPIAPVAPLPAVSAEGAPTPAAAAPAPAAVAPPPDAAPTPETVAPAPAPAPAASAAPATTTPAPAAEPATTRTTRPRRERPAQPANQPKDRKRKWGETVDPLDD